MMRKLVYILVVLVGLISFTSCEAEESTEIESQSQESCGFHNGNRLNVGPQGGCYYINSNGNKTYVDRSECNC